MKHSLQNRAFTLVELLVTMGLMALLATISIAGYYAAVRGMTQRGAMQDVVSFLRLARQRALIDQVPTAVFFMNRYLAKGDDDSGAPDRMVGTAVAVRMAGRLSYVKGDYLADEFADLERTYPVYDGKGNQNEKTGFWLYRMVQGGTMESCYSTVSDYVRKVQLDTEEVLGCGKNYTTNTTVWAFKKISSDGNAQWKVGDPYGVEIASIQLPHGYVFDAGSLPSKLGQAKGAGKPYFFFTEGLSYNSVDPKSDFGNIAIKPYHPGMNTSEKSRTIKTSNLRDDATF